MKFDIFEKHFCLQKDLTAVSGILNYRSSGKNKK